MYRRQGTRPDPDYCFGVICHNGGTCVLDIHGYSCQCLTGYTGHDCEITPTVCSGWPCRNGGTCFVEENDDKPFSCKCAPGYVGKDCEIDYDECHNNPCQNGGTCRDGVNSYTCNCVPGYTGKSCETSTDFCSWAYCLNGGSCVEGACECLSGYTGYYCGCEPFVCIRVGLPCKNDGICYAATEDDNRDYRCKCAPGYVGENCETDFDECHNNPCQNDGTCRDRVNDFSCICAPGYTGKRCETDVDECESTPCQNGGTCEDEVNTYSCTCDYGYTGDNCEIEPAVCEVVTCENDGFCVEEGDDYKCINCKSGYEGQRCEKNIDDCSGVDCKNGGTCEDEVNSYRCNCVPGYKGDHCDTNINECESTPCQNFGTCEDGVNSYRCNCYPGFQGKHCETRCKLGEVECSTDDNGLVHCDVQACGWERIDGKFKFNFVTVGRAGVWGVRSDNEVFYRTGTYENEASVGTDWTNVVNVPFTSISSGIEVVWAVHKHSDVFLIYVEPRKGSPLQVHTRVKTAKQALKQVYVSSTSNQMWGIDNEDHAQRRTGITTDTPFGTGWETIDLTSWISFVSWFTGSLSLKTFVSVSIGRAGVWAVGSDHKVYYRTGTFENEDSTGTGWEHVGGVSLKQISSGNGEVWGVGTDNKIHVLGKCHFPFAYEGELYYSCTNVSHDHPWCSLTADYQGKWKNCDECHFPFKYKGKTYYSCTNVGHNRPWCSLTADYQGEWKDCDGITSETLLGSDWQPVEGRLKQVYVSSSSNQVWGVMPDGTVYRRIR
ncbi:PREDICTED: delta-like protein D isoform X2 [Branchiostoma belcheri]|uniref:Delta-like protein D isoform X2 n=1 Tax=Branchiostoma belcheri TaxID=7741 RepID=A0A6P4YDD5_BRABE|nr:PREDICTED: delta-like protein D isoform X2 [Branchiostoma belcheri]